MATRRQEKVARVIKESVSEAICNHLNDPRIEGFVSVTRVELRPDLRGADVYLSIFSKDQAAQNKTYMAIKSARSYIQSFLASRVHSKFCPVLRFHRDEQFKKTLEIMNLIEDAADEFREKDLTGQERTKDEFSE